MDQVIEIVSKI